MDNNTSLKNKTETDKTFHFSKSNIIRDEMNLAEFPLSVLSTRVDPSIKTLEFQDTIHDKNRQPTVRKWIITGADKFGLPTSSDEEVLMGLLKLSADQNFKSDKVEFTRYELLKILKWSTEGRSYTRLQKSLDRLSGVRIKASNAFYDIKSGQNCTKNFGIIDAYEINGARGEQNAPSYFIWSETMFDSFQNGNIKKLDFDFYLSLKSAVSKRLYRYLDKRFWWGSKIEDSLFNLAHEKLGISRNYKYASSIVQQLEPALEELQKSNYLRKYEFIGKGVNMRVAFYKAEGYVVKGQAQKENNNEKENKSSSNKEKTIDISSYIEKNNSAKQEKENNSENNLYLEISNKLIQRGIQEKQVDKLLSNKQEESLNKINDIISYYDYLIQKSSPLVSKSPIGWLYKAVQIEFNVPQKFVSENLEEREEKSKAHERQKKQTQKDKLKQVFEEERSLQLREVKEELGESELEKITKEVKESLKNVQNLISKERFNESVNHAVNEKIAQSFALPSFEEWLKDRKED